MAAADTADLLTAAVAIVESPTTFDAAKFPDLPMLGTPLIDLLLLLLLLESPPPRYFCYCYNSQVPYFVNAGNTSDFSAAAVTVRDPLLCC